MYILCTFSHLNLSTLDTGIVVSILQGKKQRLCGAVIGPQTKGVSSQARELNPESFGPDSAICTTSRWPSEPRIGRCPWPGMGSVAAAPECVLRRGVIRPPAQRGFSVRRELCFRLSLGGHWTLEFSFSTPCWIFSFHYFSVGVLA